PLAHESGDPPEPTAVVEGRGQSFRFAQVGGDALAFSERMQRTAQGDPDIDGLLARLVRERKVLQSLERLFQKRHSFPVGRLGVDFGARLPAVGDGLLPYFTSAGVIGESFDLFDQALRIKRLKRL